MNTTAPTLDTEEALQRRLDMHPDDWQARLILADVLQERDDTRAAGYRALGRLRIRPADMNRNPPRGYSGSGWQWWNVLAEEPQLQLHRLHWELFMSHWHPTRREAEDAAALAYRPELDTESPS